MRALTIIGLAAFALGWTAQFTKAGHDCALRSDRSVSHTHHELAQGEFRWQGAVAQGQAVEIHGIYGDVRAEAAAGREVEVMAIKRGPYDHLTQVKIEVTRRDGGVRICVIHPDQASRRPGREFPHEGRSQSARDGEVRVDFTVRVPPGVRFIGRTVEGDIEAAALSGDVEAESITGNIRLSTAGNAQAETIAGSITALIKSANWTKPLKFQTISGDITVQLPLGANAEIQAETQLGGISTEFPLTVLGRLSPSSVTATIGRGGRTLKLRTMTGEIWLRRAA